MQAAAAPTIWSSQSNHPLFDFKTPLQNLAIVQSTLIEVVQSLEALKKQFAAAQEEAVKKLHDQRTSHGKLTHLNMQLQTLYEFISASMPDNIVLADAQKRPFFDEFVKAMFLGSNRELDDLKLIKLIIGKLREIFQEKLMAWKSKLNITSSLEYELSAANFPQTSSKMTIEEMVVSITAVLQTDLEALFRQIEVNMLAAAQQHEYKMREFEQTNLSLTEESRAQKQELLLSNETLIKVRAALTEALQNLQQSDDKVVDLTRQLAASRQSEEQLKKDKLDLLRKQQDGEANIQETQQKREKSLRSQKLESELAEAQKEKMALQEDLDMTAASLKDARQKIHSECQQKKTAQDELAAFQVSADEALTIERVRRQQEERRRIAVEQECDQLRQKCLNLTQAQDNGIHNTLLAAFAVRFIGGLGDNTMDRFKEEFEREYPRRPNTNIDA